MLRRSAPLFRVNFLQTRSKHVLPCLVTVRSTAIQLRGLGYVAHSLLQNNQIRGFSSAPTSPVEPTIDKLKYEQVCDETLESLTEYFDELMENATHLKSSDVSYSDGVLTVQFGSPYGTYVINRQTPNMQIWLSSPTSGPKRYDFLGNHWIYRRSGESLHELLDKEISKILETTVDFQQKCAHGKR